MKFRYFALSLACLALLGASAASATEVWAGLTHFFEKNSYADITLPENQDLLTDNVIFVRGDMEGLFNIAQEPVADNWGIGSPMDTEWASGSIADYATLNYQTWVSWLNGWAGDYIVGNPGVVHLISDDIYVEILFSRWDNGESLPGGGYAYTRGEGTTPTTPIAISQVKALY